MLKQSLTLAAAGILATTHGINLQDAQSLDTTKVSSSLAQVSASTEVDRRFSRRSQWKSSRPSRRRSYSSKSNSSSKSASSGKKGKKTKKQKKKKSPKKRSPKKNSPKKYGHHYKQSFRKKSHSPLRRSNIPSKPKSPKKQRSPKQRSPSPPQKKHPHHPYHYVRHNSPKKQEKDKNVKPEPTNHHSHDEKKKIPDSIFDYKIDALKPEDQPDRLCKDCGVLPCYGDNCGCSGVNCGQDNSIDKDPKPKPQPQPWYPEPKPETQPWYSEPKPEPKPEPQPWYPEPKPEPEPWYSEPKPEPKPEPEPQPDPQPTYDGWNLEPQAWWSDDFKKIDQINEPVIDIQHHSDWVRWTGPAEEITAKPETTPHTNSKTYGSWNIEPQQQPATNPWYSQYQETSEPQPVDPAPQPVDPAPQPAPQPQPDYSQWQQYPPQESIPSLNSYFETQYQGDQVQQNPQTIQQDQQQKWTMLNDYSNNNNGDAWNGFSSIINFGW